MTSQTDPTGGATLYGYDALSRLTSVTGPDPDAVGPLVSPVTSYAYNVAGQRTSQTDPLSQVTRYDYDGLGRLARVTLPDPDGAAAGISPFTRYEYDAAGNLTAQEDALGRRTTYAYNALNWRTGVTDPASGTTGYAFDDAGNLVSLTDPAGNATSWVYDGLDRKVEETNELLHTRYYGYDAVGNLTEYTDRNGRVSEYDYDNLYRQTAERWLSGTGGTIHSFSYTFDAASQLTAASDAAASYAYAYDRLGRAVSTQHALAGLPTVTMDVTFDAAGNRTQLAAAIGTSDDFVTDYTYDALHRLTGIIEQHGVSGGNAVADKRIDFQYDALGRFETISRYADLTAAGLVAQTDMRFDPAGRLTDLRHAKPAPAPLMMSSFSSTSFDGTTTESTTSSQLEPPPPTTANHATADNPPTISWPASPGATSYDVYLINMDTQVGETIWNIADTSYTPDNPLQETLFRVFVRAKNDAGASAWGNPFDFTVGQATAPAMPTGLSAINIDTARPTLVWDAAAGASSYSVWFVNLDTGALVASTTYQTAASYTHSAELPDGNYGYMLKAHNGVGTTAWTPRYDFAVSSTSPPLAAYHWSYDAGNRLTQFVSVKDGTVDYTYDSQLQLTGANYDYQTDEGYTYDANGNRTNTGYSTGGDNRLLSDGAYTYTYDNEGNRTRRTETATGAVDEYGWDHRNRLTTVVRKDAAGVVLLTVSYQYDVFDRRIGKSVTPGGGTADTEHYVYDGHHVALRFENGGLANRYLHGPAIDQILADEQVDTLTSPGEVLWPLTDNLGTVRDLASYDAATDTTTVDNHITYDAFGRVTGESNAAVDHLFGYTGREWDADVELQYNRARWYDPAVGRWISQDPIGFEAGDANLYRYVGNGPTTKTDPSGLDEQDPRWWPETGWYQVWGYLGPRNVINYFAGYYEAEEESKRLERAARENARETAYYCADPDQLLDNIARMRHSYRPSAVELAQMETYAETAIEANAAILGGGLLRPKPGYLADYQTHRTLQRSGRFNSEGHARQLAREKLGKNPVDLGNNKLRSADGCWQYRAKPVDTTKHHIHLERINPETGEVIENWHLYWPEGSTR